jgi:hypothetical protein
VGVLASRKSRRRAVVLDRATCVCVCVCRCLPAISGTPLLRPRVQEQPTLAVDEDHSSEQACTRPQSAGSIMAATTGSAASWRWLLRLGLVSLLVFQRWTALGLSRPFWEFSVYSEDGVTNQTVLKQRYDAINYSLQIWPQQYPGLRAQTVTCNFSFINESTQFLKDQATRETELFYVTQSFVSTQAGVRPFYASGSYQLASTQAVQEYLFKPVNSDSLQCWVYLRSANRFYLGTDGKPPPDEYDLPTVVLRAAAIVLGFTGLIRANAVNQPAFLVDDNNDEASTFFDIFLYGSPERGHDGFLPLVSLGAFVHHQDLVPRFVTSDELYFASTSVLSELPSLYAPSKYTPEQSIYFLRPSVSDHYSLKRTCSPVCAANDSAFFVETADPADALLYPTLAPGIAIHSLGNRTLQMLLCTNDGCDLGESNGWPLYGIVLFVIATLTASVLLAWLLVQLIRCWALRWEKKADVMIDEMMTPADLAEAEAEVAFEFEVDDLNQEYKSRH